MKAQATFVGEITKATELASKNSGKPYLALRLEGTPDSYGEKTFRPRVEAVTYRNVEQWPGLTVGKWVIVCGDAEAKTHEWQGKTYGNLVITGAIALISSKGTTAAAPATPPPARPARPVAAAVAAAAAADGPGPGDDDDVPF